jgi:hypothetical protein
MRTRFLTTARSFVAAVPVAATIPALAIAAAVLLVPAESGRAAPAPALTATTLKVPSGASYSRVLGMNNLGEMVGEANFPVAAGWVGKPVLWRSPTAAPLLLELPPGSTSGIALAINESGVSVGTVHGGPRDQAVTWTREGKATLVMPSSTHHTQGKDINERGEVAGSITPATPPAGGITKPGRFSGEPSPRPASCPVWRPGSPTTAAPA